MSVETLILELFGSQVLIFAIGWLIGKWLKVDKFYQEMQQERSIKPIH
jgi:hypothetical protein